MREFTVGEFSKLLDLSSETIRNYERIGIISPRREENGYRLFKSKDFTKLLFVKLMRAYGFPLSNISGLLYDSRLEEQIQAFEDQEKEIDGKIAVLQKQRESLKKRRIELSQYEEKLNIIDVVRTEKRFLLPIKKDDMYYLDRASIKESTEMLNDILSLSYTFALFPSEKGNFVPGFDRVIGFSVLDDNYCPSESVIVLPSVPAMRISFYTIDGVVSHKEIMENRVLPRLKNIGLSCDKMMFGHMINISNRDGHQCCNFELFIPID